MSDYIYTDFEGDYTVVGEKRFDYLRKVPLEVWWVGSKDSDYIKRGKAILPMEFLR